MTNNQEFNELEARAEGNAAHRKCWEDVWMRDDSEAFCNVEEAHEAIRALDETPLPANAKDEISRLRDWFDAMWELFPSHDAREEAHPGFHKAEDKFEFILRHLVTNSDPDIANAALLAVRDPITLGRWLMYEWAFEPALMLKCLWNFAKNPRLAGDMLGRLATASCNDEVRIALCTDRRYWEDAPEGDIQDALRHIGEYGCKQLVRERREGFPWKSAIELIMDQDFLWELYVSALDQDESKETSNAATDSEADDQVDSDIGTMPKRENDEIREFATMAITDQDHLFRIAMHDKIFLNRLLAVERINDRSLLAIIAGESEDEVIANAAKKLHDENRECRLLIQ